MKNIKDLMVFLFCVFTVLPEQPVILDRYSRILNGSAGPYEEGDDLTLTCRVTGGTCFAIDYLQK